MAGRRVIKLSRNLASQTVLEQPLADFEALVAWTSLGGGDQGLRAQLDDPESQKPDPDRGGERTNDRGPVSE